MNALIDRLIQMLIRH